MTASAEEILQEIVDAEAAEERATQLAHGRTLIQGSTRDHLTIRSPEGVVELRLRITESGPVLSFDQANLSLENTGAVSLECDALHVKTKRASELDIGGDLTQRVAGNYRVEARDDSFFSAQAVNIDAELGELSLKANDDVSIQGLRVLVNVPTEQELAEAKRKVKNLADRLALPFEDPTSGGRLPRTAPKRRDDW